MAGKFSFMDIMNAQSKAAAGVGKVENYTEIFLSPYDVKETESNFYSQDNIQELADSFLTVGQQQPTVLARVNGEYRIISGHRRNRANKLLIEQGHAEYKSVRYLYRDMSEAMLELSLLVGNAFNRELTPYEKTEQAVRLKAALKRAKDEGLEIQGRLRDIMADLLGESATNIARMESIAANATVEVKEQFKQGNLGITAAYEASKLDEAGQQQIAEQAAAGESIRAKEIAAKVQEYRTPHPESITSLCYSCLNYSTCNVKTGTCERCDEYINKAESEKTAEQIYDEQQAAIDRETKKKLAEQAAEERLDEQLNKEPAGQQIHEMRQATVRYYNIAKGIISYEICKYKPEYKVDDIIVFNEYAKGQPTGRSVRAVITYIENESSGLTEGYCIIAFKLEQTKQLIDGTIQDCIQAIIEA